MRPRGKDGRFTRVVDSEFGPVAAGMVVPTALSLVQPTGVRATLVKHFPAWDLDDEGLPIFREALACIEGDASW